MPDPTFSIIIPTYNRPRQLRACLTSLRALDYPRSQWELILVDDGSPQSLDPVVSFFINDLAVTLLRQPNSGPAAARNTGAAAARGQFLAFTDDDCLPQPQWLRHLATHLAAHPQTLCGGRVVNHLPRNPYASTSQAILDVCYSHFNPDAHSDAFFASNNLALSADRFAALGGFDPTFTTSEDRNFCDRWRRRGWPLAFVPNAIVAHANDLTFFRFLRQHFAYGQGAHRFHAQRSSTGQPPFRPDWSFYTRFLSLPTQIRPPSRATATAALLFLWQLANAAGFYYQKLSGLPVGATPASPSSPSASQVHNPKSAPCHVEAQRSRVPNPY